MKIGIDIRLIGKKRTGDEVVIFNLVKSFGEIGDNHSFELFTDVSDEKTLSEISQQLGIAEKKNFKIISLKTGNRFAWNFWVLPLYLRKNPVDIFHTQYITPFFVPSSIKIVTIVHDISFNFFPQFIKFSDLLFLKTLIPISLRRADRVVGVSKFTMDEIVRFYNVNPKKVSWIHNSIGEDFKKTVFSAEKLEEIRKKYSLPEKFILYIGTLQPRKNIPFLIESYAGIRETMWDIKLVICGNRRARNYDRRIDAVIEKKGVSDSVVFPGFIDEEDKAAVFQLAHAFVFPSLYEGFGIPVLEAMSKKVPVLCSDIPSLKEVAENGALYFDLSSLDDFSKKLYDISMESGLRSKLIRFGEERVSFFSWKKSAEKMLAIYEEIGQN